jgi:RHS repeat-associated protein
VIKGKVEDYYPFGMQMPGRSFSSGDGYRYVFKGVERDDEVEGSGNQYNFLFRAYDPRLGKFLSVDLLAPDYPWLTPYAFAENQPIWAIDVEGLEKKIVILDDSRNTDKVQVSRVLNDDGVEQEMNLRYKMGTGARVTTQEVLVLERGENGLTVVGGQDNLTPRQQEVVNNGTPLPSQNNISPRDVKLPGLGIASESPVNGELVRQQGENVRTPLFREKFNWGSGFETMDNNISETNTQQFFDGLANSLNNDPNLFLQHGGNFSQNDIIEQLSNRGVSDAAGRIRNDLPLDLNRNKTGSNIIRTGSVSTEGAGSRTEFEVK